MDLLDSILNSMEKPPTIKKPVIKDEEKRKKFEKMAKEKQEAAKKQKEAINKFRVDVTKKIKDFVNLPVTDEDKTYKLELEPMSKIYRSMVREACDEFEDEILIHSFGTEEVDRHCIIWKKGYEPCEEEIRSLKLGLEYKPKIDDDDQTSDNHEPDDSASGSKTEDGKDKFWSKYEKIIGENASGVESARVALPAKQYGCVPIEKKKDQRSIEQMMDDIRKSKKQKIDQDDEHTVAKKESPDE